MRSITFTTFIILSTILFSNAYAAEIYKRIPFTTAMNADDTLVVNYDFSNKNGLLCTADHNKVLIHFVFRGHEKSAHLPVILESAHVPDNQPDKIPEELADSKGQFTASIDGNKQYQQYEITCNYDDGRN